MTINDDLNDARKILTLLNECPIDLNKINKFRQLALPILSLRRNGVSYEELCSILNETSDWVTVSLLRSYVCRFRHEKLEKKIIDTSRVIVNAASTTNSNLSTNLEMELSIDKSELATVSESSGITVEKKLNGIEKKGAFQTTKTAYPKYDISRLRTPLTRAELGLPELPIESEKNEKN
jgi:hypothetical protein